MYKKDMPADQANNPLLQNQKKRESKKINKNRSKKIKSLSF